MRRRARGLFSRGCATASEQFSITAPVEPSASWRNSVLAGHP
ncbi:MAG: hypothetical protein OJF60_001921 [Burkholderiaceae bacterium]|nr:MAG: hypothetical protein OJF60_001921 [Burkholderiaceae bacterium]